MTRSGPLSGVKAVIHHMANSVCHRPAVRRCSKSGCSPWWPQPGRGAHAQRGQMPIRPEHRCRGLSQQPMVAARRECRIGQFQLRVHHPRLGDVRGRVSSPGGDGLADQLRQAARHPGCDRLIQQRGHHQVAITFQRFSLLGAQLPGPVPHGQSLRPGRSCRKSIIRSGQTPRPPTGPCHVPADPGTVAHNRLGGQLDSAAIAARLAAARHTMPAIQGL